MEQMFKQFQQMNKPNTNLETISPDLKFAEKLNYQNYTTLVQNDADSFRMQGTSQSHHRRSS